ncbi:MAG: sigma-54 dependent transcriptional regulator [Desulfopila sp.]|jgi:transcriptional regulator with PAS, ATPase and Fis domain|nr:sigma-54 dependent transcriptional regulator [Desulfopila sp.]
MYNILVFGLQNHLEDLRRSYSSLPVKILTADSAAQFYTTAFSRVYDLWIIDCNHVDFPDLSLADLFTSQKLPFIIVNEPEIFQRLSQKRENSLLLNLSTEKIITDSAAVFLEKMNNRSAQNFEKYLAGIFSDRPGIDSIITKSPLMYKLVDLIKDIAPTESAILLNGETGTGKEMIANILHNESKRKSGPFMAVNCGALPDSLLESELFGFEKGAFTGAGAKRKGKIESASGGTLFLDEIESMSEAMQVRLLRVLQERSFQRLGGTQEIGVDFRLITATNTHPDELLSSGKLRSDLYYRLSVFPIHIPPLRNRMEDIPLLTRHFVNKKKKDGRDYVKGVDSTVMKILLSAPWFGNIRELQNVIERAVMLADSDLIHAELIQIPSLPTQERSYTVVEEQAFRPGTTLKTYKTVLEQSAERKYLVELLDYTGGRIGESAQLAGLTPRALYNKMKIYGLKKENFKKTGIMVPIGTMP